jgi:O-antigen ligase
MSLKNIFISRSAVALDNILPFDNSGKSVALISYIVVCLAVISAVIFGLKSFILIALPLLILLSLRYQGFLLYLFLFALPFTTYVFWDYKTYLNYPPAILIIFLWLSSKILNSNSKIDIPPFLIWFPIAFVGVEILSSMKGGFTNNEIATIIRFPIFFIVVLIVYDYVNPKRYLLIISLLSIPLLVCLYFMLLSFKGASGLIGLMALYRLKPNGFFDNSNNFAAVVISILPTWLALAIWGKPEKWLRLLAGFMSIVLIFGLFLSNSRASMVGFIGVMFVFSLWLKKLKYFIIGALIIFLAIIALPQIKTVSSIALRTDAGSSFRTEIWSQTIKMIKHNFIFGVGIGNYREAYMSYFKTVGERHILGTMMSHAHNFPLTKMAEMGVFSLPLIFILYYFPLKLGQRNLKKIRDYKERAAIYGIYGGIIALLFRSIFEGSVILTLGSFYPDIVFWILLCLLLKIDNINSSEESALMKHSYG